MISRATSTQTRPPHPPSSSAARARGRALPFLLGLLARVVAAARVAGVPAVASGGAPGGGLGSSGDVGDLPDEIDGVPANDSDAFFADSDADVDAEGRRVDPGAQPAERGVPGDPGADLDVTSAGGPGGG